MSKIKDLYKDIQQGNMYNEHYSIRAVEEADEYLVVEAVANKFLDHKGSPVEDHHGTILTRATLDISNYMQYNSVVLAHHNPERPVGKVINAQMKDDGFYVRFEVYKDNDPQIYNQVKRGTLNGISVGMYINESEYSEILDSIIIRSAELVEISLVTNPSNPLSFIESVDMCSLGVCSAIRSASVKQKQNRNVDKEVFKALIKDMIASGELELSKELDVSKPEAPKPVEEVPAEIPKEEAEVPEVPAEAPKEEPEVPEVPVEKPKEEPKVTEGKPQEPASYDIIPPNVSFEDKLEEAAKAFANKETALTNEQVNLLTFIVMNYNNIDEAVKQHLEG